MESLLCPNQEVRPFHFVHRRGGPAVKRDIFEIHDECPNFLSGKTLEIGYIHGAPIMMPGRVNGTITGSEPVI